MTPLHPWLDGPKEYNPGPHESTKQYAITSQTDPQSHVTSLNHILQPPYVAGHFQEHPTLMTTPQGINQNAFQQPLLPQGWPP